MNISKDITSYIALQCDIPTIYNLSLINKRIHTYINDKSFWYNKLYMDYKLYKENIPDTNKTCKENPKQTYIFLHKNINNLFIWSCRNGSMILLKYIIKRYPIKDYEVMIGIKWSINNDYPEINSFLKNMASIDNPNYFWYSLK